MGIQPPPDLRPQNRRRSQRVRARVEVAVRPLTSDARTRSERTHSITVNAHGALLLLSTPVAVDQLLLLENVENGKEIISRVTSLGTSFMGKTQVAVEFIMPAPGFWSLIELPKDWKVTKK